MFRRFLILAVLLSGCSTQEAAPPPSASPPSASPASSSVSVPDRWNQLAGRAEKAYVAKDAFAPDAPWKYDYPATPGGVEDKTPEVASACGGVDVSSGYKVTRDRLWSGEYKTVWQDVHALSAEKAAEAIERIRVKSRTCSTYVRKEGKPERTITPDVVMTPPAGFDGFYVYCETAPDVRPGQHNCQASLARDELLVNFGSNVTAEDPDDARSTALEQLQEMVPVVAQALAAV